jgi:hypothetical protein
LEQGIVVSGGGGGLEVVVKRIVAAVRCWRECGVEDKKGRGFGVVCGKYI